MGNWTMIIQGHGQNNNQGDPKDADEMLRRFALDLQDAGQDDVRAQWIYGIPQDVPVREKMLA